jgi:predicted methyltransferase|tara:strand:- start:2005 stop:2202 length:198 start_codon:yes stop_codon:yes gene_type:complete
MKTFKELKESILSEKTIKVGKSNVEITKKGNEFKVMIDGEHLDNYETEKEAIAMSKEFINQYKKG